MPFAVFTRPRIVVSAIAALCAFVLSLAVASPAFATVGRNDYPYRTSATSGLDRWNFNLRQCTSFVAWRLNHDNLIRFSNNYKGVYWGNAEHWDEAARSVRIRVNHTPYRGSIAQFNPGVQGAGSMGHVAYVMRVRPTRVLVEEYNRKPYAYDQYWVNRAGLNFIHFGNNAD